MIKINEDDLVKRMYKGRIEGECVRRKLIMKWINRVVEYWRVRWLVSEGLTLRWCVGTKKVEMLLLWAPHG